MTLVFKSQDDSGPKVAVKKRGHLRRLIAFVGPAYLVSVGYMDTGNWATDIEDGAHFGYMLVVGSHFIHSLPSKDFQRSNS